MCSGKMTFTHPLTLSRTCEAKAVAEVHGQHAFGEYDLVDGTCERKGKKRKKEKMMNEEACAAGRINYIMNNLGSDLHSDVALPVTSVPERFRSFMPTGRCNCVRSPKKKRKGQIGKRDKVRKEEAYAAEPKIYLNNQF